MRYDVSMIIQAYMGCTLYESIVHGDVSFPVNFYKAVEIGIYDCGGGRVLEFELHKIFAPPVVAQICGMAGTFNLAQTDKRSTAESPSRGRAGSEESVASSGDEPRCAR